MYGEYGYAEETKLGKPYDLKLLRRLLPFAMQYKNLFFYSIVLVIVITLTELSLPYITKIAIDRHIVPERQLTTAPENTVGTSDKSIRYIKIKLQNQKIQSIVKNYPNLFMIKNNEAYIAYDDYIKLDKKDLAEIHRKDLSGLGLMSVLYLVLILLNFLLNFFQIMIMEYTGQKMMHDLRMKLYSHIQGLSISFFSKNPTGRLVTRITNDVGNMHDLFTSVITFLFKDVFLLLGIAMVLTVVNWKLALVSFTVLPFVIYASLNFSRQAREAFRMLRVKIAEINTRFSETITGIKIIQMFLQENNNYNKFKRLNHEYYEAGMKQVHVFAIFMPVIELLGAVALAVVIFYGGSGVLGEKITLGDIVAFITYMKMFFRPIRDIAEKYNIMQNAMASSERIFLLFDTNQPDGAVSYPRVLSGKEASISQLNRIKKISFENVCFEYVPEEPILKDVSFAIHAGESIALVGPTGSGKTTLINLLLRFYDPAKGRITINQVNTKTLSPQMLRSKMALVMQDPFLFSNTVRENIIFGNPQLSQSDLDQILSASHIKDLVNGLPEELDTVLGEGGNSISSGERQLISIARAFATNPEVIIFDEATSYVDSETELKIQDAMEKLMVGRTAVTVAHRLTTAKKADRIIVLNKGRIVETGSHDELMKQEGFYFKLHQLQDRYPH